MADNLGGIQGLDAVLGRLKQLHGKKQINAIKMAMRKGANIIKKDAVARAGALDDSETPNKIYKEIVTRMRKQRGNELRISVGVRGGARKYVSNRANRRAGKVGKSYETGGIVWYWRILEFGSVKMAARPFMRPALKASA